MSHRCNDFIIKNELFIRDFDSMYKNINDPWGQKKKAEEDLYNLIAFAYLEKLIKNKKLIYSDNPTILDIGCGPGYHAEKLKNIVGGVYLGVDISHTVIEEASNHENNSTRFEVLDIRIFEEKMMCDFDLIFSSKTLYYVSPEIDIVISNLKKYMKVGGIICFVYNESDQSYSSKYLNYITLREKFLDCDMEEVGFVEIDRLKGAERCAIGVFRKIR